MSVLKKEMRFLILNRVAKRMFFGLNRMAVHPYPNNPLGFLPWGGGGGVPPVATPPPPPHCPEPQWIYSNITKHSFCSNKILIICDKIKKSNNSKWLTKAWYMDPWPLELTHHVTWKVLIGSSNLYNKIKAKVLRQRAVFPWVTYYYCFSTRAVALPGWCYGHSPNNNPPLSPRPSQDLKQQQHLSLIVHPFYRNNQKCITIITGL